MNFSIKLLKKNTYSTTYKAQNIILKLSSLLKTGVHLGTTLQEHYPPMPYIIGFRHNILIIDLTQTIFLLKRSLYFLVYLIRARSRACIASYSCGSYFRNLCYLDFFKKKNFASNLIFDDLKEYYNSSNFNSSVFNFKNVIRTKKVKFKSLLNLKNTFLNLKFKKFWSKYYIFIKNNKIILELKSELILKLRFNYNSIDKYTKYSLFIEKKINKNFNSMENTIKKLKIRNDKKRKLTLRIKLAKIIRTKKRKRKMSKKKFNIFFKKIRKNPKRIKKKILYLKNYLRNLSFKYRRWKYFKILRKIELQRLPKNNYKRWCIPVTNWARGALTNQNRLFYYRKMILIKFKKTIKKKIKSNRLIRLKLKYKKIITKKQFEYNIMINMLFKKYLDNLYYLEVLRSFFTTVIVVDNNEYKYIVGEASSRDVPSIVIVSTNMRPSIIDYPIPGNSYGKSGIKLYINLIYFTIKTGAKLSQYFITDTNEFLKRDKKALGLTVNPVKKFVKKWVKKYHRKLKKVNKKAFGLIVNPVKGSIINPVKGFVKKR